MSLFTLNEKFTKEEEEILRRVKENYNGSWHDLIIYMAEKEDMKDGSIEQHS